MAPPQKQTTPAPPPAAPAPVVKEVSIKKTIVKNLAMGGTAGLIGATCTYPMDMIKTRLQNQSKLGVDANKVYNGVVDCFQKIIRAEGVAGLYRGLPAQMIGIVPEKALKLTINDLIRYSFTNKQTGEIPVYGEVIAGASAGFSQVVVTNPYELVKVRLQTQSTAPGHERKGLVEMVRGIGLNGMFKGASATLLRDVPFSAIYFTLYGNMKARAPRDPVTNKLSPLTLFFCGTLCGTISAASVTPADVIKTRIQSGTGNYKGIVDCFSRTLAEEGPKALFKGVVPRMMIISPLFGITLATYEVLQGYFA